MVRSRGGDRATFVDGQDVLCTLSGYRFVPHEAKGRESRLTRFEGASVIVAKGQTRSNIHRGMTHLLIQYYCGVDSLEERSKTDKPDHDNHPGIDRHSWKMSPPLKKVVSCGLFHNILWIRVTGKGRIGIR